MLPKNIYSLICIVTGIFVENEFILNSNYLLGKFKIVETSIQYNFRLVLIDVLNNPLQILEAFKI